MIYIIKNLTTNNQITSTKNLLDAIEKAKNIIKDNDKFVVCGKSIKLVIKK